MFEKIQGNAQEDFMECCGRLWPMLLKIPGMVEKISGDVQENSEEFSIRFWGMFKWITGDINFDFSAC